MRVIKFCIDNVLPKVKFCIDNIPQEVKFYTDKAIAKTKFCIETSFIFTLIAVRHVDKAVAQVVAAIKMCVKSLVHKTVDRIDLKTSLRLALKDVIHKDSNRATVKNLLMLKASGVFENIEKQIITLAIGFRLAILHIDEFAISVKEKLVFYFKTAAHTVDHAIVELTVRALFIGRDINRSTVKGILYQRLSFLGRERGDVQIRPITNLFGSGEHMDKNHISMGALSVLPTKLSDINPLSLADINSKTLNEISYKEVL